MGRRFARALPSARPCGGAVLFLTLWLVLVLTVIAYSLAYEMRVGMRMTSMAARKARAHALARAAVAKAVLDLRNDRLMAMATQPGTSDSLDEIWAQPEDKTDVERGGGRWSVRLVDEDSKFNVNMMQGPRLALLAGVIEAAGDLRRGEAQDIAAAIADFIDQDFVTAGAERGDEIEVWTRLGWERYGDRLPAGWTFRPRNDRVLTLQELLGVPGVTPELLAGAPGDRPDDPLAWIDALRDPAPRRAARLPLQDYLTPYPTVSLNVNTATPEVLERLFEAAVQATQPVRGIVDRIVELRRATRGGPRDAGRAGITDLVQLVQAGIPADVLQRAAVLYPLGVTSSIFTIYARGEYEGVRQSLKVTVRVNMESYPFDPNQPATFGSRDPAADGWLANQPGNKLDPAVRVLTIETF